MEFQGHEAVHVVEDEGVDNVGRTDAVIGALGEGAVEEDGAPKVWRDGGQEAERGLAAVGGFWFVVGRGGSHGRGRRQRL